MGTDLQAGISERRYRLAALIQAYAAENASEEWQGKRGATLLYRPLAIHFSPLLLRLRVSAGAVTMLALLGALSLPPAALTFALAGWLGCLVLWLVFYSVLDFLYTQVAILRRVG